MCVYIFFFSNNVLATGRYSDRETIRDNSNRAKTLYARVCVSVCVCACGWREVPSLY